MPKRPPIDPEADLTETYTMQNITVNYPSGLTVTEADNQLIFGFDENFANYFALNPPQALDYYEIANDTLEITAQSAYNSFAPFLENTHPYKEAVSETTFAGYDALTFTLSGNNFTNYVYVFDVDGEFFIINLIMQETFPVEAEIALMERIIGTMVISDVEITLEPFTTIEPFPELTIEPLITMQSRRIPDTDAVELTQAVSFDDIGISFSLPTTWVYDADTFKIATNEPLMSSYTFGDVIPEGEILMGFLPRHQIASIDIADMTVIGVISSLRDELRLKSTIYSYVDLPYEAMYMPFNSEMAPVNAFFYRDERR
ncbi:MAG: hypothetical protein SFZ02_08745 [bacterium]|nr:hypothetical protein [bacterium]